MKKLPIISAFIAAVCVTSSAFADLKWDQTTIEVKTGANDQMAVAHFKYQNTGASPVHFKSVKPACGCTTVQSQQEQVLPGEKGEITARLNVGDRTGLLEKTITVNTDEPMNPTTVLTIKALIPQQLEVSPTFLFWQAGEAAKPKTISVKVSKDWQFPIRSIKANSSSWDFQATVEKVSKDEYKVAVQPRDTSRSISGTVTIEAEDSTRKFVTNLKVIGSDPEIPLTNQAPEDLLKNPFSDPPQGP